MTPLGPMLVVIFFISWDIRSGDATFCDVALPQDVSLIKDPMCYMLRKKALARKKKQYGLTPGTPELPYPLLDMTQKQLLKAIELDPFLRYYANKYLLMAATGNVITKKYLKKFPAPITNITDYPGIATFFHEAFKLALGNAFRLPSPYEPFVEDKYTLLTDKLFAEQRLAGINPMSIKRLSTKAGIGLDWDNTQQYLNPNFDWEGAVQAVVGDKYSLNEAMEEGYIFGVRYEECDNLPRGPDLTEPDPTRTMWDFTSPIALFAVNPERPEDGLMPVAIQMDYTPDSPVYSPQDGDNWLMAKLNLQVTDLGYAQIVEHLAKVHFVLEPFCVCMRRTLSFLHPLHQILKYTCRDVTLPDKFGFPVLLEMVPQLFAYGLDGLNLLLQRGRPAATWQTTDLRETTKIRGMDNKTILPYFPYRDDGEDILTAIEDMVRDYIDLYYSDDTAVKKDKEVQNFLNEVSSDGTGKTGGIGQIPGLPAEISTKSELHDIVSRIIWLSAGQHTAVNYLISDYAAFVPNNPTKLYNDTRVAPGDFNVYRLPNKLTATMECSLTMSLASYRYDNLFDYGYELQDSKATDVVNQHYAILLGEVSARLEKRNDERHLNGDLTYPYLLPQWLPNGIET